MMEEKPDINKNSFHLAGIIPIAGHKKDFGFQWDNALMPIAENYTAIERCVMECAYACLLYTSPSPRDVEESRMPSSA